MEEKDISPIGICSAGAFLSNDFNKNYEGSNFCQYYKNAGRTVESSTQQRRETFLREQKEKHDALFDGNRELSELFEENEMSAKDSETEEDAMDTESLANVELKHKKKIKFRMTRTEWFTEVPEDLADKWLVKFCPEGRRRLIVSNRKITKSFNKFGHHITHFLSNLPGGGKSNRYNTQKSGLTVLDCVFHEPTKTYFILDMLVWNSTSFFDCEAELRHCWIRAKYVECPECFEAYGIDSFKFKVLFDYPAETSTIELELSQYDTKCDVMCEGLLFYHKEAPYITESTPLVTWLKPYMLREKLNINIPPQYEAKKPHNYINLQMYLDHISRVVKKKDKTWKKKSTSKTVNMDTQKMEIAN